MHQQLITMARKSILVVDDEPMVRESLQLMLKLDGHAIDLVASGPEALQRYDSAPYDIVLTDNRMPGMSGLQLAHEIKRRNPRQRIILFSGSPPVAPAADCDLVLIKPFSASELRQAVNQLADA
jgi:two-component system, cell cycle response regulator CpdR